MGNARGCQKGKWKRKEGAKEEGGRKRIREKAEGRIDVRGRRRKG